LIEQRLKEMMVLAIDQRDVHGRSGEILCDREPTEAGADNSYTRSLPCDGMIISEVHLKPFSKL
jgi:hypothetical protein